MLKSVRVTDSIMPFSPGASPPPVIIPILMADDQCSLEAPESSPHQLSQAQAQPALCPSEKNLVAISIMLFDKNSALIDVRSPGEFEQGHIPGFANLPILNNEERHQVGLT